MTKVWLLSRTNCDQTKRWNYPRQEHQPNYSRWEAGRRGDPCDGECPNSWVRDFYGVHAWCGGITLKWQQRYFCRHPFIMCILFEFYCSTIHLKIKECKTVCVHVDILAHTNDCISTNHFTAFLSSSVAMKNAFSKSLCPTEYSR